MTIEAFGRSLPDLAAATKVWRDFFSSEEEVYQEGFNFMSLDKIMEKKRKEFKLKNSPNINKLN